MSNNRGVTAATGEDRTEVAATHRPDSVITMGNTLAPILRASIDRSPKSLPDELNLIRLSQQGDSEAFARLYDHYVDRIHRYVLFRVTDGHLAEDITSQVFIKMWEKLPTYQVGQSPIAAWLYRIAHNAVIDHYRAWKTAVPLDEIHSPEVAYGDGIDENLDLQMKMGQLREALQHLTEGQREVLILKFIEGFSIDEIARQLGKREGAVRALQMRGLRELAKAPTLQQEP